MTDSIKTSSKFIISSSVCFQFSIFIVASSINSKGRVSQDLIFRKPCSWCCRGYRWLRLSARVMIALTTTCSIISQHMSIILWIIFGPFLENGIFASVYNDFWYIMHSFVIFHVLTIWRGVALVNLVHLSLTSIDLEVFGWLCLCFAW